MSILGVCIECKKPIETDEAAIYRKMVQRNAKEYMCIDCLAKYLGVSRQAIEDRIRYYRESGTCVLFR